MWPVLEVPKREYLTGEAPESATPMLPDEAIVNNLIPLVFLKVNDSDVVPVPPASMVNLAWLELNDDPPDGSKAIDVDDVAPVEVMVNLLDEPEEI